MELKKSPIAQSDELDERTVIVPPKPIPWYKKILRALHIIPDTQIYFGIVFLFVVGGLIAQAVLRPQQVVTRAVTHQAKVSVLPATLSLPPEGTLQVWATTDSPLAFVNVQLTFNPAVVKLTAEPTLTTAAWGRVIKQTTMASANATGTLDLVIGLDPSHIQTPPTGTFQVATLQFGGNTTTSNATTMVSVTTASSQLVAVDTTVFALTTANSTIIVNPAPTPTPVPTTGVTPTMGVTPTTTVPTPTPGAPDTTPPTVTITSPTDGSPVPTKGNMAVKTTASDASGIAKITIALDGATVKTCTNVLTCQYNVNAGKLKVGPHTITATATDNSAAKNTASTTITVTK